MGDDHVFEDVRVEDAVETLCQPNDVWDQDQAVGFKVFFFELEELGFFCAEDAVGVAAGDVSSEVDFVSVLKESAGA